LHVLDQPAMTRDESADYMTICWQMENRTASAL